MRSNLLPVLLLPLLLWLPGCQASQSTPTPSPTEATATPSKTPGKTASFTVEVLKGPTKSVEIWLEGPTKEERTVAPDQLTQTFQLAEGVYDLTVRSEGYRNFALKIQIPEMDSVKAAMTPLPQVDRNAKPVDDPFQR